MSATKHVDIYGAMKTPLLLMFNNIMKYEIASETPSVVFNGFSLPANRNVNDV